MARPAQKSRIRRLDPVRARGAAVDDGAAGDFWKFSPRTWVGIVVATAANPEGAVVVVVAGAVVVVVVGAVVVVTSDADVVVVAGAVVVVVVGAAVVVVVVLGAVVVVVGAAVVLVVVVGGTVVLVVVVVATVVLVVVTTVVVVVGLQSWSWWSPSRRWNSQSSSSSGLQMVVDVVAPGVVVVVEWHPLWAGLVRPMPWLWSHS
jgi:hypothetical protein